MVRICVIDGCKSEYYPDCGLSYHRIHGKETAKQSWLNALKLQNSHKQIKENSVICKASSSQSLKHRRSKFFKRQSRVPPEDREPRKQTSDPGPATSLPQLQKHGSYPQYIPPKNRRSSTQDQEVGSLLIRAVTVINQQSSTSTFASTSTDTQPDAAHTQRASHTPAVRSGPPLSCNFCWNTVDECGRILRRKTQYHCPECRTNLCIVPCFHEYHDGPESETSKNASSAK